MNILSTTNYPNFLLENTFGNQYFKDVVNPAKTGTGAKPPLGQLIKNWNPLKAFSPTMMKTGPTGPGLIGAGITAGMIGGQIGDWAYKNWEPATKFGNWVGGGIYDAIPTDAERIALMNSMIGSPEGIMKAGGYPLINPAEYPPSDDYENIDRFTETAEEVDDSDNWFMRGLSLLPLGIGNKSRGILMRGLTNKYMPSGLNFRDSRFYKPATSAAGGYNVSQLNRMNALGGYYSEPAREARRFDRRGIDVLNRAAGGKKVGNVDKLLGKYGYKGTPGSGNISFTGKPQGDPTAGAGYSRKDDSWGASPFRGGGLASLFTRRG